MQPTDDTRVAIVRVGDGRGFLMDAGDEYGRIVVTAAHCLPQLPPAHGASHTQERTYPALLGSLDDEPPSIWTECLFADPVADLAVLGRPDDQALADETAAFDAFVNGRPVLRMKVLPIVPRWQKDLMPIAGHLLSLNGVWLPCNIISRDGLFLRDVEIAAGMSGSPAIVDGYAVAVVALASSVPGAFGHGPQARLSGDLPVRLVRALQARRALPPLPYQRGQSRGYA